MVVVAVMLTGFVLVGFVCTYEPQILPLEFTNMSVLFAVELAQRVPQSVCAKDVAPLNMYVMFVTLDTSHLEMSRLNDVAPLNTEDMVVTLDTSHFDRSPWNNVALKNIQDMSVTLDTSHFDRSPLNEDA